MARLEDRILNHALHDRIKELRAHLSELDDDTRKGLRSSLRARSTVFRRY
jgi:hypothetical protein